MPNKMQITSSRFVRCDPPPERARGGQATGRGRQRTGRTNETVNEKQKEEKLRLLQIGKRSSRYKVTVLPKLQYCRVVSSECCGAGGAAYTSDAVDRHLCSLRVPCERERRTRVPPAAPPAGVAVPPPPAAGPPGAGGGAPAPAPPPPPPGPFIYNTPAVLHRTRTPSPPAHSYTHPIQARRRYLLIALIDSGTGSNPTKQMKSYAV